MLDQRARLAEVVETGFCRGERVQRVLGPEGEGVLVGREAVGQLCPNRRARQWGHQVVVGGAEAVALVVPVSKFVELGEQHKITKHPQNLIMYNDHHYKISGMRITKNHHG